MQNSALPFRLVTIIRQTFLIIGFIIFLTLGAWSLSKVNDQTAVRGTDRPETHLKTITLLPR